MNTINYKYMWCVCSSMQGISSFDGVDDENVTADALADTGESARKAFHALSVWLKDEYKAVVGTHIHYEVEEGVDRTGERVFRPMKAYPIEIDATVVVERLDVDTVNSFIEMAHELNLSIRTYNLEATDDAVKYTFEPC